MKKVSELMDLSGCFALVTGGAGHIGLSICETLMEMGASVMIVDQDKKKCLHRCSDLNSRGFQGKAVMMAADLSNENQTRKVVRASVKYLKRLDIVVHAAAFVGTTQYPGWAVDFNQQSLKAWDAAMRVNLSSAFVLVQEAKGYLEKSNIASVVLISSIYGLLGPDLKLYKGTPMKNPAAYGVSKAGLLQLTRYLATILAPAVRVNAITPGGVWRHQNEKFHQRYKEKTPLGRMAIEEDFKGAVAYLASDLSRYVTGHNLVVDGGFNIW